MADKDNKASAKNKKETKKVSFFQGVKKEWGKIIWPTREDLTRQTALVVIISVLMGVIITVVDSGALQIINWLMSI
jgi:preprotein translocase subunit SecE